MDEASLRSLATLLRGQNVGALGTLRAGAPMVTMVAYAPEADLAGYLLLLSGLARHARALAEDSRAALLVHEPGSPDGDPQTFARVSLEGNATPIPREDPGWSAARDRYLEWVPTAVPFFSLGDFQLYRFVPEGGRFVAGFAQSYNLGLGQLRAASEV